MDRDIIFLNEQSDVFQELKLIPLLGTAVSLKPGSVTIYVRDDYAKNALNPHTDVIGKYFNRSTVTVLVNKDYFEDAAKETKREGRLLGYHYLTEEYMDTPFFRGKSNADAVHFCDMLIDTDASGVFVINGESGTGKSHLLQNAAKRMLKKGCTVYLNGGSHVITDIKESFRASSGSFHTRFNDVDLVCIDDIQVWNRTHLDAMFDPLFTFIDHLFVRGKKVILTSDVPVSALTVLPPRISTRLQSGYLAMMDRPGRDIMMEYIDYFSKKHDLPISATIRDHIIDTSPNIRILRSILNIATLLFNQQDLNLESLATRIAAFFTVPGSAVQEAREKAYSDVYNILREHMGVPTVRGKGSRKPRAMSKMDNIIYFLFQDKISKATLLKRLSLQTKHAKQAHERGEKAFDELAADVKREIKRVMGEK